MKKRPFFSWPEFSGELKRRGVYPTIAAYAVVGWVFLQLGEITFEPLGLPRWAMPSLIALVVVGFPIVLTLSWFFDFSLKGISLDINRTLDTREDNDRPSIAVLPFVDMSPDQDQAYFCEGIAEEILNALTKIQQLHVVARSSSFQYKSRAGDVRKIGRELGARTILEGSVRKFENQLRVTAQLVQTSDGYHLWSRTFNEELKDIFEIQDEIATCIAEHLLEAITPKQQSEIKTTSSKDVTAYEYYLRGRQFINRLHKMDIEYARQMFRQSIEIDPDFALAWSGYADCHSLLVMYVDPKESYRVEAQKASERALEIDPELSEAHASRGLVHLISEEFGEAEVEFEKAIELNARSFQAYYYYARTRFHQGDLERAEKLFEKAAEMDPSDYQSRCLRVQILRGLGRTREAVSQAKDAVAVITKHLEWNPDDARALHLGAGSLIVLGKIERAKRWLRRALQMDPDDSVLLYNVACNFATLGEIDEALGFLEQAVEFGTVSHDWMYNDTDLETLRPDPRFQQLLQTLADRENDLRRIVKEVGSRY